MHNIKLQGSLYAALELAAALGHSRRLLRREPTISSERISPSAYSSLGNIAPHQLINHLEAAGDVSVLGACGGKNYS